MDACLLRPGDSLILFTDGVTEARSRIDRDLYGDDRLRDVTAGVGDMPAAQIADAIQQAVLAFSGANVSDDAVALVLKVAQRENGPAARRPVPGKPQRGGRAPVAGAAPLAAQ